MIYRTIYVYVVVFAQKLDYWEKINKENPPQNK